MAIQVDLGEYWRIEERYAKAGYRLENVQVGQQLERMVPTIHSYDYLSSANGVYLLEIEGVTAFLIKTEDCIRLGTYEDHLATGGKEVIHAFLRARYPNQKGFE